MAPVRTLLVVAALLAAGASPAARGETGYDWRVLTTGPEGFALSTTGAGQVTVRGTAPDHTVPPFYNRRQILVERGAVPRQDQTVCATWARQSRFSNQEGLAVRVRGTEDGRVQALTLTKNVFAKATWWINLLAWRGTEFRTLGQFDMSDVVAIQKETVRSFPWRVCLRAEGARLGFKLWLPRRESEPAWDDPEHTGWVDAPVRAGVPGWYVGHLDPGDEVRYRGMMTG